MPMYRKGHDSVEAFKKAYSNLTRQAVKYVDKPRIMECLQAQFKMLRTTFAAFLNHMAGIRNPDLYVQTFTEQDAEKILARLPSALGHKRNAMPPTIDDVWSLLEFTQTRNGGDTFVEFKLKVEK